MSSNNSLRMSGLNSGLDTESIVNALTMTTKNKINKKEREVMKLEAQQEAYRDIIQKFNDFKDKYLDILNGGTCLKSTGLFNSYKSTLSNSAGTNVNGVSVSNSVDAAPGTHVVTVDRVATQTTLRSAGSSGKAVDFSAYDDAGKSYSMAVTVGDTTKTVTFSGSSDKQNIYDEINAQLKDAFGARDNGEGIVTIDSTGKISSIDKSAVAVSAPTLYQKEFTLNDISDLKTGTNTLTVTVGDATKTVSFQTVDKDYFNDENIYEMNEDGSIKTDGDGNKVVKDQERYDLYKQVAENERQYNIYKEYAEWEAAKEEAESGSVDTLVKAYKQENNYNDHYESAKRNVASASWDAMSDDDKSAYTDFNDYLEKDGDSLYAKSDFDADIASYEAYKADPDNVTYSGKADVSVIQSYSDDKAAIEASAPTDDDKLAYYKEKVYTGPDEETFLNSYTAEKAVNELNRANIENNLGAMTFGTTKITTEYDEATKSIKVTAHGSLTDQDQDFSMTQSFSPTDKTDASATNFGGEIAKTDTSKLSSQISVTSKLSELGVEADENGNYNFKINGVDFSFSGDSTVSELMKKVNASTAGVKMTYTTLTNQFVITANEYGNKTDITIDGDDQGLLAYFGFGEGQAEKTVGQNTVLNINGVEVETTSNSYTVDGTTYKFSSTAEGTTFTNEISRDYSKAVDAIKSFVEDYNKLIEDIYGYLDDEPNDDYYFLTDDDLDEMDLSESQQEKWEKLAKKGILYNDSTVSSLMTKMRSVLYSTVTAADGNKVGLYTLGVTTSSDWTNHGKLVYDDTMSEEEILSAFEKYADEFATLFTDSANGIAYQLESIINSGVKTTGAQAERGTIVQKAGVSGTASATSNAIYTKIKNLKSDISTLQERYETQQDRYWSIYSNMETQLGNLNSNSSSITSLLGSNQ